MSEDADGSKVAAQTFENFEQTDVVSEIDYSSNTDAYRQSLWEASELSHPVYKKISAANGRINRMTRPELLGALSYLKLSTK